MRYKGFFIFLTLLLLALVPLGVLAAPGWADNNGTATYTWAGTTGAPHAARNRSSHNTKAEQQKRRHRDGKRLVHNASEHLFQPLTSLLSLSRVGGYAAAR